MAVPDLRSRLDDLRAEYDARVDVLHLMRGEAPVALESDGGPRGVELVFSAAGVPFGVTVIGYRRNGWDRTAPELADIVASHLEVPVGAALRTIAAAMA
ncbi:hypothetical protein CCR97_06860 [Rhodoplanes elegans]|uniref:Uncharacterized protein n=1 Tax=Rhodoplanes elegans TaxID=29408 RepID=A0A327K4U1_9BRAD|nr:hypothetical protein [Rhodoplanes elegans]MBK5957930.1 hypothetical protein [Rhodoplanes elegans]RAI32886.1 hypothetical protein CH338_23460 [Rhodoplanes elegans]